MSQQLSDGQRDLATLTFNLEGHGGCRWRVLVIHLYTKFEFVGLSIRKILRIYCVSINQPGDLDLWLLDLETGPLYCILGGQSSNQFQYFWDFSFSTYWPTRVWRTTWHWHHDLDLWPRRSLRLSVIRVFVLHQRRPISSLMFVWPSYSKDMTHFLYLSISLPACISSTYDILTSK